MQISEKTVLIAPLNWGLGHATRCIVIINKLLALNCKVIVASDGAALEFLKQEFPNLHFLELPSYNITYAKNSYFFKIKLASQFFTIYKAICKEKIIISDWVDRYAIDLVISDNRFGAWSNRIPSVYITHQLQVISGVTTWLTSKIHQKIIKKFTTCWVPDFSSLESSLAGELGRVEGIKYENIGPLSRLKKENLPMNIDVLFLISGPEPQRSILENIFKDQIKNNSNLRIVLVGGKFESEQIINTNGLITYYNYATSNQMNDLLNSSKQIVCRSGYSTIMDLCVLNKKALLLPTPGQDEQEYLAQYLDKKGFLPYVKQDMFTMEALQLLEKSKGLPFDKPIDDLSFLKLFTHF